MLSSTFTDLEEHREKAIGAIHRFGYMASVMEYSGANAVTDVIGASMQMVRDAAAYVCIIGMKYGQTPKDPKRNPDGLSVTELEFNEAMRLGRPTLLFIMGDQHKLTKADIESDQDKQKKLDAFRERAKRMHDGGEVQRVYETFDSLEDFTGRIAIAIGNLVRHLEQSVPAPRDQAPKTASQQTISNIPISIPRHFLGRNDDLAAIDKALELGDGRAAVTALHGLRGVGKTTLAAAFAERRKSDYRATWWVRAETESTTRADLVGLGVQLGWTAPDVAEELAITFIKQKLSDEGKGIVLIYDNANNPDEIVSYVPSGGSSHIIITSNAPNWDGVATAVEIQKWSRETGADWRRPAAQVHAMPLWRCQQS
jgi:hypothetical protein